jgi:hypothetical protein
MSNSSKQALLLNVSRALRANLLPACLLQCLALFIGLSYFFWPAAQGVFVYIAQMKMRFGSLFAIISTAIFGGLIPWLYLLLSAKIKTQAILQLLFYCLLWACMGLLIDSFYGLQSYLFGDDLAVATVAKKTAFDQFVFSTLITCPLLTLSYLWKDNHFNWSMTKRLIDRSFFRVRLPTLIVTNWLIWIPAVILIYMMPAALQIPLFNLVLCFFVLVLAILNDSAEGEV